MSNTRNRFSPELHARAVRRAMEHQGEHTSPLRVFIMYLEVYLFCLGVKSPV